VGKLLAAQPGVPCFTCDLRGIGESQPRTCGQANFDNPYGCDYFYAIHSIMLGYPYLGQRTYDLLRVLDWLRSFGHDKIHLAARGWGTLPATFAALLSPEVVRVTLNSALTSYADLAESEFYRWPLSSLLPGVLSRFDLSDCYRALAAKGLRQIDPTGP
jgi:pimeloyl-ACP methyl ester carboxylesterase